MLALKGDTAIDDMVSKKQNIHSLLVQYLMANGYKINIDKSKNVYALDSIVAEYKDIGGNIDNIKIEINYMNRVHILETKQLTVVTNIFEGEQLKIHCVNPIEIYAAKICALLSRTTVRDLFDIYILSKYNLFNEEEKQLLKRCFMLEYIAINDYKLEDLDIKKIDKLDKQDIKVKLLPTLRDRNPKKSDVDEMKKTVKKYLEDILAIDVNIKSFYDKFQSGSYEPELLFDDKDILERVKAHPMIIWKLNNKIY